MNAISLPHKVLILVLAILIAGISSLSAHPIAATLAGAGTQSSLFGKKWKLIEINGVAINSTRAFIEFDEATKRTSGDGGCNRFAGSFELNGPGLKFSRTLSTKRACLDQNIQQIENTFLANLERVTGFLVRGDELYLNANGRSLLTFTSDAAGTGEAPPEGHVTGTVTYLQRIALPANAMIKISLRDVSRRGATIAEQTIRAEGRQVPFNFDLQYDPGRIVQSHRYVVQARIESRGRLLFSSTNSYPVITGGHSNTARILVNRLRR